MPRGGMREGAGNKAASQSLIDPGVEAQSYFCSVCGNGHDFKSRSHLNAHEKTASHKSKIDPEFAAVEESFFCSICGNGHDFKSRSHLIQHEKTDSHKRKKAAAAGLAKIDPEFAAVEEAKKADSHSAEGKEVLHCDFPGCSFESVYVSNLKRHSLIHSQAEKEEDERSYFCIACGNGHDFKSRSRLNEHEKIASHKRKIDPEFAVAEEADSFFCSICGNGHDFKSRSHLIQQHP